VVSTEKRLLDPADPERRKAEELLAKLLARGEESDEGSLKQ
jgi:hypothetical protein